MIRRVRAACLEEKPVVGALMFGSFETGEGDERALLGALLPVAVPL